MYADLLPLPLVYGVLDKHLDGKEYLVGNKATIVSSPSVFSLERLADQARPIFLTGAGSQLRDGPVLILTNSLTSRHGNSVFGRAPQYSEAQTFQTRTK